MLPLKLIFSLIAVAFAGRFILILIDRRYELDLGCFVRLMLSFTLGLGALSLQMFCYSLFAVSFTVPLIVVPWVVLSIIQHLYLLGFSLSVKCSSREGGGCGCLNFFKSIGLIGWLSLVVIASQALYAFFSALLMPLRGWDAWAIWFFKAKVFFAEGKVAASFLADNSYGNLHLDYPLLMPLIGSWVYIVLGSVNEVLVKGLFPVQFVSMLALFYFILSRKAPRGASLLFTALLSLTPLLMTQAGGLPVALGGLNDGDYVGYVDITIALFMMGAAGFIYLYMLERKPPYLYLSAAFLGFGAWTKNEGLTFIFVAMIVVTAYLFRERRDRKIEAFRVF
jgi:hypothetical protein